jgi:RNA polymerase sigma factor (sigma-70 family)
MPQPRLAAALRQIRRLAAPPPPLEPSDAELLGRFLQGQDQEAFAALVRRHGPLVWRVCRRLLPCPGHADDAFQATFLTLAQKAASIRRPAALASWLHGVAWRVANKARSRLGPVLPGSARAAAPVADPAQQAAWRELGAVLEDEVARLPEGCRDAILLCYWQGLTNDKAARQLGCPPGTLKTRLARARGLLHQRLTARGVTLPVGAVAVLLAPGGSEATVPARLTAAATALASEGPRPLALAGGALRGLTAARLRLFALLGLMMSLAVLGTALSPPLPEAPPPAAEGEAAVPGAGTDSLGDPLPPGAVARLGTTRFWRGNNPRSLAFSPDGKMLLSGGDTIHLLDARTGRQVRRFPAHGGVAFSPDGKTVACRGLDEVVRLWDTATGKEPRFLWPPRDEKREPVGFLASSHGWVAFSPDGKLLADGGHEGVATVWDVRTEKVLHRFKGHKGFLESGAFSPDGKTLATAGRDGTVRLWSLTTGKPVRALSGHRDPVFRVVFSADGKTLASCGHDHTVRLWEVATGKERGRCRGHTGPVASVAFAPDGKTLASCGEDGTVRLWDAGTGKERRRLTGFSRWVRDVAFSPDGSVLAAGDSRLRLWSTTTGKELRVVPGIPEHIYSGAFTPDGKLLVTAGFGGRLRLWEMPRGKEVRQFFTDLDWSESIAVSPDGRLLLTGDEKRLALLDLRTGKKRAAFLEHKSGGLQATFSPDGKIIAAMDFRTVRLWDAGTGGELAQLPPDKEGIRCLAFAPDGKTLAVGSNDGFLRLWDVGRRKEFVRCEARPGAVVSVAFSPTGKFVASGTGMDVRVWETATGKEVRRFQGHSPVAFGPDGRTLACVGTDGKAMNDPDYKSLVWLWDVATGRKLAELAGHKEAIWSLRFSPDGNLLVSTSRDTTALVWDVSRWARAKRGEAPGGSPALWRTRPPGR